MTHRRVQIIRAFATLGLIVVLFMLWIYFHFNGGTPWERNIVQSKVNVLLSKKYPNQEYTVTELALYDFKQKVYTVGVTFPDYPQDVFLYKPEDSDLKYWVTVPASNVMILQAWNGLSDTPPQVDNGT